MDAIVEPLGSIIFVAAALILFALGMSSRKGTPTAEPSSTTRRHKLTLRSLRIATALFTVANFAMHILEIARLAADGEGVGLLPFCLVPLLSLFISLIVPSPAWSCAGFSRPSVPHRLLWIAAVVLWVVWTVITLSVKLAAAAAVYSSLGQAGYEGPDSKYPYLDKLTDNIVIIVVYAIILALYLPLNKMEYARHGWRYFW